MVFVASYMNFVGSTILDDVWSRYTMSGNEILMFGHVVH